MPDKSKHERALDLINANRLEDAARLLKSALKDRETSELWNDWATLKMACGEAVEARKGYEKAVLLDPANARAQFNLGLILAQQGEAKRGFEILKAVSPLLGEQEQKLIAGLTKQRQSQGTNSAGTEAGKRVRRVLLVHDMLPYLERGGSELRLLQIAYCLRASNHEVTYLGRHPQGHESYQPVLHERGVRTFAGDAVRLRALGMDITPQWSLEDVLKSGAFDAVMLYHSFTPGISVVEQYLDDIRRLSPNTRIVVLTDDCHGIHEWRAALSSGLVSNRERAMDFLAREFECYRAADLILAVSDEVRRALLEIAPELPIVLLPMLASVTSRSDFLFLAESDRNTTRDLRPAPTGPEMSPAAAEAGDFADKMKVLREKLAAGALSESETEAFIAGLLESQIEGFLEKVEAVQPKPFDPDHRFSINLVEEFHPDVLTAQPPESRYQLRAHAYADLAQKLLEMGMPAEAQQQFRHMFFNVRNQVPRTLFFAQVFSMLERCYRELGENETAALCGREAKLCLPELNPLLLEMARNNAATKKEATKEEGKKAPLISVIVPTVNRYEKLLCCLQALAGQTLPPEDFEVIVIDDGSTDGTYELIQKLKTPFSLRTFRQSNQGGGAARKAGVEMARGEYLLLMNDDTMSAPDLLEEHLRVQQELRGCRVAVLGSFDYPPEARKRALTHFFSTDVFLFPHPGLRAGQYYDFAQFVTCNLCIRRDAILECGSFDPKIRWIEDTEMGLRLSQHGYKVLYHPAARALHDHLDMTAKAVAKRSRTYGALWVQVMQKHPSFRVQSICRELGDPVSRERVERTLQSLAARRQEIEGMVEALSRYDDLDFEVFFNTSCEQGTMAETIMKGFRMAIPMIQEYYGLEGFCSAWMEQASRQEAKSRLTQSTSSGTQQAICEITGEKNTPKPAVSIVIPTFNRREKLDRCLQALAAQSLSARDFEVIVVDDGSNDGTAEFVQTRRTAFSLTCLRQSNQGAGAARKAGVDQANGEYVLLINDDTIAHEELLAEHLAVHRKHQDAATAVLGSFEYERAARNRALTWFLNTSPFMFPQLRMTEGSFYGAMEFVTCNLSLRRDLLLKCGSFDPTFRLGEDSELGIRFGQHGGKVLYHPRAQAWHDHLEIAVDSLVQRAEAYGHVYEQLLRKHNDLQIPTRFGSLHALMTAADLGAMRTLLASKRAEVAENVKALSQYDSVDFSKFFNIPSQHGTLADAIQELFSQAVPYIYWFHLIDSFCKARIVPSIPQSLSQEAVHP